MTGDTERHEYKRSINRFLHSNEKIHQDKDVIDPGEQIWTLYQNFFNIPKQLYYNSN